MLPFLGRAGNNADVGGLKKASVDQDRETGMFRPHANLGDEINRNIVQSEIEGGVFLSDLQPRTVSADPNTTSLLHGTVSGRQPGADLGTSGILPAAGAGCNRRIDLGRNDVESPFRGPRDAA